VYLFGQRGVLPYKIAVCAIMLLAGTTLIKTTAEIDAVSTMGTGLMLWVNIPLCLLLANVAMRAYHDYIRRLDAGEFAHEQRR
jgi:AGCS family alanine or glycine:cation symporter